MQKQNSLASARRLIWLQSRAFTRTPAVGSGSSSLREKGEQNQMAELDSDKEWLVGEAIAGGSGRWSWAPAPIRRDCSARRSPQTLGEDAPETAEKKAVW